MVLSRELFALHRMSNNPKLLVVLKVSWKGERFHAFWHFSPPTHLQQKTDGMVEALDELDKTLQLIALEKKSQAQEQEVKRRNQHALILQLQVRRGTSAPSPSSSYPVTATLLYKDTSSERARGQLPNQRKLLDKLRWRMNHRMLQTLMRCRTNQRMLRDQLMLLRTFSYCVFPFVYPFCLYILRCVSSLSSTLIRDELLEIAMIVWLMILCEGLRPRHCGRLQWFCAWCFCVRLWGQDFVGDCNDCVMDVYVRVWGQDIIGDRNDIMTYLTEMCELPSSHSDSWHEGQ